MQTHVGSSYEVHERLTGFLAAQERFLQTYIGDRKSFLIFICEILQ